MSATATARQMFTRPEGATMAEVIEATGAPQYNELKRMQARGYAVRKVRQGNATRYFAEPPAAPSYEAAITGSGQVTIPKEVRERLGLRAGGKVRFTLEDDNRAVVAPAGHRLSNLFGMLGTPPRSLTSEEMDEVIRQAAIERHGRSKR
ncbi:MAG: AbrB/MazE/SpoVT family DNA-binding domain-containing protein [Hyphomicrobiales bacterium]